jgi:hypothetical protein
MRDTLDADAAGAAWLRPTTSQSSRSLSRSMSRIGEGDERFQGDLFDGHGFRVSSIGNTTLDRYAWSNCLSSMSSGLVGWPPVRLAPCRVAPAILR